MLFLLALIPTYADVAPILQAKCCRCHSRGSAAPFSLTSFTEAKAHADSIREAVDSLRMPPWHAEGDHWSNDRSLTEEQRQALLAWIDGGCREGAKGVVIPDTLDASGWRIKPDHVVTLPEQTVPASGTVDYRYIPVATGFTEDRWVQAVEVKPGNRKVVHHSLVFCGPIAVSGGLVGSFLPGDEPTVFPEGYARRIPANTPITFQMHYTATGKEEKDATQIGFVFCKPPRREVRSLDVENRAFFIPAGAANHELRSAYPFPCAVELLSLTPHMHLRGKDFAYSVGGKTILSVPRYDFNWQTAYQFAEPLKVPAFTTISCVAHYDNSADNPNNPDPAAVVKRGPETTDEMMIGFVDYAVPYIAPPKLRQSSTPWATLLVVVLLGLRMAR